MSITASAIVNVAPGVINVGGSALNLVGLFLTTSARVPIGTVQGFATAGQVSAFFGPLATETSIANIYFAGYDGSTAKPAQILFMQYAAGGAKAYLRSGALPTTLANLQALSGVLTINVGGTPQTSSAISLSAATSFSNAATIIQAAFSTPGFTVAYDSVLNAFTFTTTVLGVASSIGYATGSLAAPLSLTQAGGATLSPGIDASTAGQAMDSAVAITQNFATFSTVYPITSDILALSAWCSAQSQRYMFVSWESSTMGTVLPDTSSYAYQIRQANYSGTISLYDPNNPALLAAFTMGSIASIDFSRSGGRTTLAFRSNASSLFAGVTNLLVSQALIANGYNFYGGYATANQPFNFLYPGQVSGSFAWIDSMTDEIWMNAGFQLALIQLLTNVGSIPYSPDGYAMIEAALLPQIQNAVSFGAIRTGVTLSATQIAQANSLVGADVSAVLQQRGWYAKCIPATPAVRAVRGPLQAYVLYVDGGSVQSINLNSILVA